MILAGAAFLLVWVLLLLFGTGAMPSYFAAWLFWVGVPAGALPIVLANDAWGRPNPLVSVLRNLLRLAPLAALMAIPWLFGASSLFARGGKLPDWWVGTLVPRDVVILVLFVALAVAASWPRRPGQALALLAAHVVLMSVAAVDWLAAPQPGLVSSSAGPVLIAGQMVLAAGLAGFLLATATESGTRLPFGVGLLLGLVVAFWALVHFEQFLVVWSANLPDEAAWYVVRGGGLGTVTLAFAAVMAGLAVALLPSAAGRVPTLLASLLAPMLLALLLVGLWLVTPAYRGGFSLSVGDVAAMLGLGALLMGVRSRQAARA